MMNIHMSLPLEAHRTGGGKTCRTVALLLAAACLLPAAEPIRVRGVRQQVDILRDRWGVPHIYARNSADLFFAQGYVAALDRLFQIDLWRRAGTGKLAEAFGPSMAERDALARAFRFRGDWNAEWRSYSHDAREIIASFVAGINAYIRSLNGRRQLEFRIGGYDPGLWVPEDCSARVAGLLMSRNAIREVQRAIDVKMVGLTAMQKYLTPNPPVAIEIPKGLDPGDISPEVIRLYNQMVGPLRITDQGSNNWVVDGALSATGKPLLANDPHRSVSIPALRKTVHLVAPGWNVIGAGEPALPGVALGHNEDIAFGFTIVGTDQQDLYVERLNPANPNLYRWRGTWRKLEVERQTIMIKDRGFQKVDVRYSVHGPIIHMDQKRLRAFAVRWAGLETGGAGYLGALSLARARNWQQFLRAAEGYKVPAENLVYADRAGNIGWIAAGLAPLRRNWSGLLPVPGENGEYEWDGYIATTALPRAYNPSSHFLATANHNILPEGYPHVLSYEWAQPFRFERIREILSVPGKKFTLADFQNMQQDVVSVAARRFQGILKQWKPPESRRALVDRMLKWNARLDVESPEATVYELWITRLPVAVFGDRIGLRTDLSTLFRTLETSPNPKALQATLDETVADLIHGFGGNVDDWKWGRVHRVGFRHPLNVPSMNRGPVSRPGDANTLNATGGPNFAQTSGASYRQIIDVANWDRSVMTNVPGESGNPESPHYADLIDDWASGRYHPMPYSRRAVEQATTERIRLLPAR